MKLGLLRPGLVLLTTLWLSSQVGLQAETASATETPRVSLESANLVSATLQRVLLKLGPPASVYLAGEDAEIPRPEVTDPVIFRYDAELTLDKPRTATIFVTLEPETYTVSRLCIIPDKPPTFDMIQRTLPNLEVRRERRKTASDDFDVWITDEVDPDGEAEVMIYPSLGLTASRITDMPSITLCYE